MCIQFQGGDGEADIGTVKKGKEAEITPTKSTRRNRANSQHKTGTDKQASKVEEVSVTAKYFYKCDLVTVTTYTTVKACSFSWICFYSIFLYAGNRGFAGPINEKNNAYEFSRSLLLSDGKSGSHCVWLYTTGVCYYICWNSRSEYPSWYLHAIYMNKKGGHLHLTLNTK